MSYTDRLIKAIHTGRKFLGLGDAEYRALIGSVVPGKTSCKELTARQLSDVLARMREVGFKPRSTEQVKKLKALWHSLADEGIVRVDTDDALDAYIRRITRKNPSACTTKDLSRVIETLKKWLVRVENLETRKRLESEFQDVSLTLA